MFTVEVEQETDGRWIAEVPELPGVLTYGASREEAITRAQALSLRVLADRLEHGEDLPRVEAVFSIRLGPGRSAQGYDRDRPMILRSEREVANTRVKLEARYSALRGATDGDVHVRELTMESLKKLINQLKEEIARYEAHQPARR